MTLSVTEVFRWTTGQVCVWLFTEGKETEGLRDERTLIAFRGQYAAIE